MKIAKYEICCIWMLRRHKEAKLDMCVGKRAKSALKRYLQSNTSVLQRTLLFNTQKSKRFNTNSLTQLIKRLYERSGKKKYVRKFLGLIPSHSFDEARLRLED